MGTFKELNITEKLIMGLQKESITIPTKIQSETIELAIDNNDIIAEAITGSGKTLSYVLPAFERIDTESKDLHTIILAPTHELVLQINNVIKTLAKNADFPVRSTTIIGEVNIKRQLESLKQKPHIVVGTPGRVIELIKMKKLKAHQVKTIVIDEADKLLSDDYLQTIKDIIKTTLRDRQLLVFSASINDIAMSRATELMKEPKLINITAEKMNNSIEHLCVVVERRDKMDVLRQLIYATKPVKAIVFINKNNLIQEVVSKLVHHKIKAVGIYGNATKLDRKKTLDAFKSGKANVLIASDLVARGLDIQDITHIINLDLPVTLDEYIHRVGRTGRAGKKGTAISIVTESEVKFLMKLEKVNNIEFDVKELHNGKLVDAE